MEKPNKIYKNDVAPSSTPSSSKKKITSKKKREMLPPELQEHMGRVVCKDLSGKQYLGTVVSYNNDTGLFAIKYSEEEFEDVEESEIRKMLTTNNHYVQDLLRAARIDSDPAQPNRVSERASARKKNTSRDNCVPGASKNWKDDYYCDLRSEMEEDATGDPNVP